MVIKKSKSTSAVSKPLPASRSRFPIVAIGASAGGLEAMMELLKHLPSDTGMAFIYVQHLSPDHKSLLTEILSKKTTMKVQEIDDMDKIKPDNVFVIPYNKGIEVTDGHIKLIPRSASSAAISIDVLFSSLAQAQKERVIGIVLSGSASDGTVGIKDIKHEGGLTFAQDDTAKFTSMPHSAIAAGVVDFILSPKEIALELARLSKHPFVKTNVTKKNGEDLIDNHNPDLKIILSQIHKIKGVDFSAYKMNTIKRRVIRRMLLYKITTLKEYAKLLTQKNEEIDILYQDLLINVTSFFRDTDTHKYLKENLFPKLLKRKKTGESLRIWVPACATGEEAYSIAMILLEIQGSQMTTVPVQIFATDLSEKAISKARIGVYTKHELETVSPKRIQRFFTKAAGSFRVNKAVRDICVFAPHNILHDPPFSRLDFISCCNLFIYLDTAAQKKAANTFHYALNNDGFLMLGKSENISHSAHLFTNTNKTYKIFSRKLNSSSPRLIERSPRVSSPTAAEINVPSVPSGKNQKNISVHPQGLDHAIDAVLVSEFMPASVVINHQLEIVQFRGNTDLFLTHPKGKATFNILKMARPEIAFELRNAISKVIKTKHRIRKSGLELNSVKSGTAIKIISIEILPLKIELDEPLLLIVFTEQEQSDLYPVHAEGENTISLAKDRRIVKLEQELAAAHADALAIAQEQEAFTEELQSANEEIVSSNEELQTVNEELETSKEEIESANEELMTTNQELQTRNDLLNESYDYSEAVLATLHEPLIVLDKYLRVKSANKTFYKIFNVKEEETEGELLYDLGNRQWNIPRLRELLEDILPKNSHFHDYEITHTFPIIGEKTMLLNARRIIQKMNHEELILLAISDITVQATARKKIEDSEKRYNKMLIQSPFAFAVLKGKNKVIAFVNDRLKETWGKGENIEGKPLLEVLPELKGTPFPALIDEVYKTGIPYHGNETLAPKHIKGRKEDVYYNFVYQPYLEADETISGVTIIAHEVTAAVIVKKALEAQHEMEQKTIKKIEDSEKRYNMMLMKSPFGFAVLKGKNMVITLANDSIKTFWGKGQDLEGKPLFDVIPELKDSVFPGLVDNVYSTGIPFHGDELLAPIVRNGKKEDVYFNFVYQPYLEADETISGITIIGYDVTEQVNAKRKIEESEKRFRSLANNIPLHVFIIEPDAEATISYWNKNWLNYTGQTMEEAIGNTWGGVMHPDDVQSIMDVYVPSFKKQQPYFLPAIRVRRHDGEYRWHSVQANPRYLPSGEFIGFIGVGFDIHEQKLTADALKASEQHFRMLADLMPAKISNANVNGDVIYFNKQWLDFSGYSFEELKDFGYHKIMHPEELAEFQKRFQKAAQTGTVLEMEMRFLNKNGEYKWHLNLAAPVKDENGNPTMWVGVTTEIQQQKKYSQELENAVQERVVELKEKNEELIRMNKELAAFTYISSHDLQEPLRKIQTFAGRILDKESQNLTDNGKNYFRLMQNAAHRMQILIQDLLAFSHLSTADRKFETTDLSILIDEVKNEFKEAIAEKNAVIEVKESCKVHIIPFQFRQLLNNLIGNALKFSKPNIPPHIIISSVIVPYSKINIENLPLRKEYCHIRISDNGIGFEEEFSTKIFEVFQKLHGKDEYSGTGIGLAIVKKIVDNHNGIITATSILDKGTTFNIYIPALQKK